MIEIIEPVTPVQLDAVRALLREFVAWHCRSHVEDLHLIERYFDKEPNSPVCPDRMGHRGANFCWRFQMEGHRAASRCMTLATGLAK